MDMRKSFHELGIIRVIGYSLPDGCGMICNVQFSDGSVKTFGFQADEEPYCVD